MPSGVTHKVLHEAHIARLLEEGGQETADPTIAQVQEEVVTNASTLNDVRFDSAREADDQRSSRRKPAIRRSKQLNSQIANEGING